MTAPPRGHDVIVNVGDFEGVPEPLMLVAALRVLVHEGAPPAEISVTLLGDEDIRAMNRDYLGEDRPTDVIAFALGREDAVLGEEDAVLGDVYLGYEQAARQADSAGVDLGEELVRLTVHGVLHVLGHDHPPGDDRFESPMYRLQERFVREVVGAK